MKLSDLENKYKKILQYEDNKYCPLTFHYTSIDAAKKIIQSKYLRATIANKTIQSNDRSTFTPLNDSEELIFGRKIINKYLADHGINEDILTGLLDNHIAILSTSYNSDSEAMWYSRHLRPGSSYGDNGCGCALGLLSESLSLVQRNTTNQRYRVRCPVIYGEKELGAVLEKIDWSSIESLDNELREALYVLALISKDINKTKWNVEQEARIVLFSDQRVDIENCGNREFVKVGDIASAGNVLEPLPIQRIVLGPHADVKVKDELEDLLEKNSYLTGDFVIEDGNIPIVISQLDI
jgi:hypothetical protein